MPIHNADIARVFEEIADLFDDLVDMGEANPFRVRAYRNVTGTALELNAHPERLDLLEPYCRMAKDEGALVAIDSDAHDGIRQPAVRRRAGAPGLDRGTRLPEHAFNHGTERMV